MIALENIDLERKVLTANEGEGKIIDLYLSKEGSVYAIVEVSDERITHLPISMLVQL